jgi:hypothetical protein
MEVPRGMKETLVSRKGHLERLEKLVPKRVLNVYLELARLLMGLFGGQDEQKGYKKRESL